MIVRRGVLRSVVVCTVCLGVLGCTGDSTPPEVSDATTAAENAVAQSSQVSAPAPSPTEGVDDTVVNVDIAGGVVTPTNGQAQAAVGRPIVLLVNSDIQDQLHVHSVPEHTFDVQAARAQSFQFVVDVPGRVDVELHDLGRTVVTIEVRP